MKRSMKMCVALMVIVAAVVSSQAKAATNNKLDGAGATYAAAPIHL